MSEDSSYTVGYGRPPKTTRWKPGESGNRRGAPRGRRKTLPHEDVLGREVPVTEGGIQRTMPADEAFLRLLVSGGLAKEGRIRALALEALEINLARFPDRKPRLVIFSVYPELGKVDKPMRMIGMGHLLDPFRPTANLVIETWLVQEALERLGSRRFSIDEQETIVAATRKAHKVVWPDWWEVLPT